MNTMQTTQRLPTNWSPTIERSTLPTHAVMATARSTELASSKAVTQPMLVVR